jgi:hypothetical protein
LRDGLERSDLRKTELGRSSLPPLLTLRPQGLFCSSVELCDHAVSRICDLQNLFKIHFLRIVFGRLSGQWYKASHGHRFKKHYTHSLYSIYQFNHCNCDYYDASMWFQKYYYNCKNLILTSRRRRFNEFPGLNILHEFNCSL